MNLSPGNFLVVVVLVPSDGPERDEGTEVKLRKLTHTSLGDVVRLLNLNEGSPVVGSETGQDPQRRNKIKDNLST